MNTRLHNQIFLFMEVTRSGVAGLIVVNHVTGGISIALVHVQIPRQQTKEEAALEKTYNLDGVTHIDAQFMEATRSGLFGLSVVNLAVQESNVVIVPAQILGLHTGDDGVATLRHGGNHRNVTFGPAQ